MVVRAPSPLVSEFIELREGCYLTEQQTLYQETTESDCEVLINNIKGKSKRLISWSGLIRNLVTGCLVSIWNRQRHQQTETKKSSKSRTEHQMQRQK